MPKLTPHERIIKTLEKRNEVIDVHVERLMIERRANEQLIEQHRKTSGAVAK